MESEDNIKKLGDYDKRILNKFINILPDDVNIFFFQKEKDNVKETLFYLAKNKQNISKNKLDPSTIFGYITGVLVKNKDEDNGEEEDADATILWVGTNSDYTRKGIGIFLIILYASYLKQLGFETIELDDDSDLARTENSIYLKLGFKYRDESEGVIEPEMIGNLEVIADNWDKFKEKYKDRGFFK